MISRYKPLLGAAMVLALVAQPAYAKSKKQKEAEAAAAAAAAAPAASGTGNIVAGIAVANLEAAVANTDAYRLAAQQRPVTYKSNFDNAKTRGAALDAQLKPLIDKFNADRAAAKPNVPALQQQAQTIQQLQERGKEEIQQILMPPALSEAYVREQIEDKLDQAVQKAMEKHRVSLLLQPGTVIARANAYELTDEIVTELNVLIPNAQIVPPQGWMPREVREAREQQAAAQKAASAPAAAAPAAAPAPRPAGPQPDGR
ncbi:OmpH family outer membrane protein [Novosphingobium sp.]|uniref:OmpH family outer membrane protein n=1 Tax=Novosphingobium sp. TaxID=1874826 RepID=UPI001ED46325|nr:OmpH family outer membrane protein [Novosphingobium sp.]MBK6800968.1 OmpH family outer membrane protein [Novosphingobium sp.]MBK9011526.1 OmpH family outer membrane protein [Novosphingobium sp.]